MLCYDSILFSCQYSLPFITDKLKHDDSISHDEFKVFVCCMLLLKHGLLPNLDGLKVHLLTMLQGALFVLSDIDTCKCICHNWINVQQIWPMIVKADHSEKSSILKLINRAYQQMSGEFTGIALNYTVRFEKLICLTYMYFLNE